MQPILSGKTAIITGASEGFGREVAQKFASAGASLMLCARDAEKLEKTCLALRGQATADQKVLFRVADVSKAGDVDALVDETIAKLGGCDILMNNAGIYGPKGDVETVDWLAWVKAIEINLYGSVLMCRALLPHFKMRRAGKIIQLSGGGATAPLPRLSAYAVSKAAIVRFVETLAEEVRGQGIDVNALAPGALNTAMLDEVIAAGPAAVGEAFYARALKQKASGGAPLDIGANLALFLASAASTGITGKLLSAVWDNWENLPAHMGELGGSDLFTLRRISGRDRNMAWADK